MVFGTLRDDERAWGIIREWVQAAKAAHALRNARIGLLGHPFEGMLDMNADPTAFDSFFGMHIDMIEMCDLKKRVDEASQGEVEAMKANIREFFCFPEPGADRIAGPVTAEALEWSARVAVGLERLADDFGLDGIAHYYRGVDGNDYQRLIAGFIVGALAHGARLPFAGEGDLKNCAAMLMMDRIGAGGSFCELHPADFRENFVFIGHDGPAHIAIANEKPDCAASACITGSLEAVSRGVQDQERPGDDRRTDVGSRNRFKLVLAEGESIPGAIPATGNTNTRCRFEPDLPTFIERWSERDRPITSRWESGGRFRY